MSLLLTLRLCSLQITKRDLEAQKGARALFQRDLKSNEEVLCHGESLTEQLRHNAALAVCAFAALAVFVSVFAALSVCAFAALAVCIITA